MNEGAMRSITPQSLFELWQVGKAPHLIDVRAAITFDEGHVPFARWVEFETLTPRIAREGASGAADEPVYVICQIGKRSQAACEKLAAAGLTNVVNVEGGTNAWREAGLPVAAVKGRIALARQVQMTAGSLVLVGSILGWLVHPAFVGLAAFIGAGLVFSGATDSCMMGMMLARMPWNRRPAGTPAAAKTAGS